MVFMIVPYCWRDLFVDLFEVGANQRCKNSYKDQQFGKIQYDSASLPQDIFVDYLAEAIEQNNFGVFSGEKH
ncbi:MAG: hypothetical protein R3C17_20590 [Planctomycetaceae bacterium]